MTSLALEIDSAAHAEFAVDLDAAHVNAFGFARWVDSGRRRVVCDLSYSLPATVVDVPGCFRSSAENALP